MTRRTQILRFIVAYHSANGVPPTLGRIADEVGLGNRSSVHSHVVALADEGYVEPRQVFGQTAYYPLVEAA